MYLFLKRIMDIIISLSALLLLLPLIIPIMLIQKLTAEHKIFYLQDRIGYKNQKFQILKFATMLENSPNMGSGTITLRNDPRITPLGKFLRRSKINELPQIINVLKGEMSLVGPRPVDMSAFEKYTPDVQDVIYNVKPGITGIGSIVFRDEEGLISASGEEPHLFMQRVISPYKGALELWYQKNASLRTDVTIMFLTAWVIVRPKSQMFKRVFTDLPEPSGV